MLLLALLFATEEVFAVAPSNYFIRNWQVENGLPQNSITALVQTRDGYIWAGTYDGLVRFDGVRFVVFDNANTPEMKSSRVTSLFEANDGTLWIGHEGGELTQFKSGRFQAVDFHPNWNLRGIYSIGVDETGNIWLASPEGLLSRLKDGLVLTPPVGSTRGNVRVVISQGKIWVGRNGIASVFERGQLKTLDFDGTPAEIYVTGICPCHDGGLWVVGNGLVRKWDGKKWSQDLGAAPWGIVPLTTMIESRAGVLIGGTPDTGLYLLFPQGEVLHYTRTNGLPSDWVQSVCEDCEGNLFVGTHSGLVMMHESSIATVEPSDHWQGRPVLTVTSGKDSTLWAGTEGAGLYSLKDGQWAHFGQEDGLPSQYIWSLSEDSTGCLWGGTWGAGVFVQRGVRFERAPGLGFNLSMLALLELQNGGLLVGTPEGLLHYQAGQTNWVARKEQLSLPDVRAIVEDKTGAVWIGMIGGGLARLENGELRQYRKTNGLASDFVQCLRADDDGTLWIGTSGGGLVRLKDGRFATIGVKQGLLNNIICDIEEDARNFFWISSHRGILRVSKDELNRCADGLAREVHCLSYDMNDGLPTIECSGGLQPAGCKTADGRLWFPTSKGLVVITPETVEINSLPPPIILEQVLIDDQITVEGPDFPIRLQIPPGRHRVEFQYTGLSFTAPEKVRFKYRLSGFEKEWINAGAKRFADYNYIPPGEYIFQLKACNNDGVWNEAGPQIRLAALPYYWQTLWFRALAGGAMLFACGGIVWLDARRRMRGKLERIERQQTIERERARIAHDIHDDLGAHLTRIGMLSDPARVQQNAPDQAAANFSRIHRTAHELTRAMDEIVWAVNPQHDTFDSLVNYLHKYAQDFLESTNIRCRLDLPFELPSWSLSAEMRHNLFLAFKEALNNILKHAAASEVRISLTFDRSVFTLEIEDNGRGFTTGPASGDSTLIPTRSDYGNGLKNMNHRLAETGGTCEIQSFPGRGTKVIFVVPVKQVVA